MRHKLPTTQTNLYTKFHENPSITLAYIAILVRTENGEQRKEKREQRTDPVAIFFLRDSGHIKIWYLQSVNSSESDSYNTPATLCHRHLTMS